MMPIYVYVDKHTDYQVEVLRELADYDKPPTDEELLAEERGKERDWERRIGTGIGVDYAQGSLKGNM